MRKLRLSAARQPAKNVLAVSLASAVAVVLLAGWASARSAQVRQQRITFLIKTVAQGVNDPLGVRPGDTVFAVQNNLRSGRWIGKDRTACIVVDPSTDAQCSTTVGLPGGTLAASFTQTETSLRITGVITGGTGRYLGARGAFVLHRIGHPRSFNATVQLL